MRRFVGRIARAARNERGSLEWYNAKLHFCARFFRPFGLSRFRVAEGNRAATQSDKSVSDSICTFAAHRADFKDRE